MPNDIPIKYPRREGLPSKEDEPGEAGEIEKGRISQEELKRIEAERYGEAKESEEIEGKEKTAALEGGESRSQELRREAERHAFARLLPPNLIILMDPYEAEHIKQAQHQKNRCKST